MKDTDFEVDMGDMVRHKEFAADFKTRLSRVFGNIAERCDRLAFNYGEVRNES